MTEHNRTPDEQSSDELELTPLQNGELTAYDKLPAEYLRYFEEAGEDADVVIPPSNPRLGELRFRVAGRMARVMIGQHTNEYFDDVEFALEFIRLVLSDELVFCFGGDVTERYRREELDREDIWEPQYQVWSGALRDTVTGLHWNAPLEP